jgi:NAD(P)-dependent dehydrogenase (short-subunit alcohol dehydrogenase family)
MFQSDLLKGRTIVVTGGGAGLGAEMARRFAGLGAHAVVLRRRREKLDEGVASIATAGGKASAHACDVRDAGAVQEVAERVGDVYGLVNNAAGNFLAISEDLSSNGFKTVVDIVLNGTFHTQPGRGIRGTRGYAEQTAFWIR